MNKRKLAFPVIPDVARSLLKGTIMSMVNSGLITATNAKELIALLQLKDA